MSRYFDGAASRKVLQFPNARRRPSFSHRAQTGRPAVRETLDRLQPENAELRAQAIDLILQIQSLRNRDWDGNSS
jgi:hypothetical protein